jgi:putative oxidoreductase
MSVATLRPAKPVVPFFTSVGDAFSPFAEPLVRVAAGLFLVPHGAQKLFGWFGGYGIDATGQFFAAKLGLPASLALVAGIIEFFGGLCLPLASRPVVAAVVGLMAVAVVKVHFPAGFFGPTADTNIRCCGASSLLLCHSRRRPIPVDAGSAPRSKCGFSSSIWNGLKMQRWILRRQASRSSIV